MRSFRCSTGIFQMRENSRKFDFAKNSRLQRLQRELLHGTHRNAQSMPRAWKLSWLCNWLHAQLPMQHRNFPNARKFKKIRFCEKFAFAALATRVAARHASKRSKHATSVEIELALQLVACAASDV